MDLWGIAAIVTGGASGLGGATAERLARAGAKVTIFDLNADLGRAIAAKIGGHFVRVDVVDEADVEAGVEEAERVNGKARILVNCAGIARQTKVIGGDGKAAPLADFAKIVSINLIGTFAVLSKFAARLQDAESIGEERGVIINTASIAAYDGQAVRRPMRHRKAGSWL